LAPVYGRLGLDAHGTTAQVRAWLADLDRDGSFGTAVRRLEAFTALQLSESTAGRATVEVSRRLRAEELKETERLPQGEAVPRRTRWQPQRLHPSPDGSMTPMRDPWKRDLSEGPLRCRYRECETAVCYETCPDRSCESPRGCIDRAHLRRWGAATSCLEGRA